MTTKLERALAEMLTLAVSRWTMTVQHGQTWTDSAVEYELSQMDEARERLRSILDAANGDGWIEDLSPALTRWIDEAGRALKAQAQ